MSPDAKMSQVSHKVGFISAGLRMQSSNAILQLNKALCFKEKEAEAGKVACHTLGLDTH